MGFTLNKDPDVDSATATIAVSLLDALEQVQKQLGHFLHLLVSSAYVAAEERYHWYRKKKLPSTPHQTLNNVKHRPLSKLHHSHQYKHAIIHRSGKR